MPNVVVTEEFCIKTATAMENLVEVCQTQEEELVRLRKVATKVEEFELQKVASSKIDTTELRRALIAGGMPHNKAASLCAGFVSDPKSLVEFATKVVADIFVHAPADGHGVPKSASVSSSTTVPPGPFE